MAYLEYDYEIAHRERVMCRQRAVWTLRGWLRMERRPRAAVASALVFSGAMALDTAYLLKYFGLGLQPYRWVLGVIVAWPCFIGYIRWWAEHEFRHLIFNRSMREYLVHDESAAITANEVRPRSPDEEHCREVISRETGRALGKIGGPGVILFVAITVGLWLAWQFISQAPTILAESILDGPLSEARPALAKRMHLEPWLQHLAYATAPHFMGLAFAAFVAGIFWPPFLDNPF